MNASAKQLPDASHPIEISVHRRRVVVTSGGTTIADTRRALCMHEAQYAPVLYVPLADVRVKHLLRSAHSTYCPYKGDCAYYSLRAGGRVSENAVWTYALPYPAVAQIAGHVAFYPDRVDAITELD